MSFLEEITKITTAAPSLDPELVGFEDESAFMSAKATVSDILTLSCFTVQLLVIFEHYLALLNIKLFDLL